MRPAAPAGRRRVRTSRRRWAGTGLDTRRPPRSRPAPGAVPGRAGRGRRRRCARSRGGTAPRRCSSASTRADRRAPRSGGQRSRGCAWCSPPSAQRFEPHPCSVNAFTRHDSTKFMGSRFRGNDSPHGADRNASPVVHSRESGNDAIDMAVVHATTVIPADAGMTTTVDAWLSHYRHSRESGNPYRLDRTRMVRTAARPPGRGSGCHQTSRCSPVSCFQRRRKTSHSISPRLVNTRSSKTSGGSPRTPLSRPITQDSNGSFTMAQ